MIYWWVHLHPVLWYYTTTTVSYDSRKQATPFCTDRFNDWLMWLIAWSIHGCDDWHTVTVCLARYTIGKKQTSPCLSWLMTDSLTDGRTHWLYCVRLSALAGFGANYCKHESTADNCNKTSTSFPAIVSRLPHCFRRQRRGARACGAESEGL